MKRGLQSKGLWKSEEQNEKKEEAWSDIRKNMAAGTLKLGREGEKGEVQRAEGNWKYGLF